MIRCSGSQIETGSVVSCSDGRSVLRGCMYEPNSYPNSVICPVDVIFNPSPADTKQHQVWIWFHVAAQQAVWTAISEVFQGKTEHTTVMWFFVVSCTLSVSIGFCACPWFWIYGFPLGARDFTVNNL